MDPRDVFLIVGLVLTAVGSIGGFVWWLIRDDFYAE